MKLLLTILAKEDKAFSAKSILSSRLKKAEDEMTEWEWK